MAALGPCPFLRKPASAALLTAFGLHGLGFMAFPPGAASRPAAPSTRWGPAASDPGPPTGGQVGTSTTCCALATCASLALAAVLAGRSSRRAHAASSRALSFCRRAAAVGEKVVWNGKQGVIRFLGKVQFAQGEWAGIELDAPTGMHNGSVLGVAYFDCPPQKGIFAPAAQLGGLGGGAAAAPAATTGVPFAGPGGGLGSVSVGQRVFWYGQPGTVRFVGSTSFSSRQQVGLELDSPVGMHDGTVMGTSYFTCEKLKGVYCESTVLSSAPGSAPATSSTASAPAAAAGGGPNPAVGDKVVWNGKAGTVRYVGETKFAGGEWVGVELDMPTGMHDGTVLGVRYFTCPAQTGIFSQASMLSRA